MLDRSEDLLKLWYQLNSYSDVEGGVEPDPGVVKAVGDLLFVVETLGTGCGRFWKSGICLVGVIRSNCVFLDGSM